MVPRPVLIKEMKRLGLDRLREECARILPNEKLARWNSMNSTALVEVILDNVSYETGKALAAEGQATQRTPWVGGPSWRYIDDLASPHDLAGAMQRVPEQLPEGWTGIGINPDDDSDGLYVLHYTSYEYRHFGRDFEQSDDLNKALLMFDRVAGVVTVAARSRDDAAAIGDAIRGSLGLGHDAPLSIPVTPTVDDDALAPQTVGMIEAVYGKVSAKMTVSIVDMVTSWRPGEEPIEDSSRGKTRHMLADKQVRERLCRGDAIVGLAFEAVWRYDDEREPYVTHITLGFEDGRLSFRVTRGGQPISRTCELYHLIRRTLTAPTDDAGRDRLKEAIAAVTAEDA